MNNEVDELNFDDFNFDIDDDFDLNFDEEEAEDKKELENIKKRKEKNIKEQNNPFDLSDNEDILLDNNDTSIDNNRINNDLNINDSRQEFSENDAIDESLSKVEIADDNLFNNESEENIQSDIIKMNEEIDNINVFMKHMEQRNYQLESSRFLTKKFAEASDKDTIYNINITIDNETITAITGYDSNNKIITIPKSILNVVQADINKAMKQII